MPLNLTARIFAALSTYQKRGKNEYSRWLITTRSSSTFITIVCSFATFTDGFAYGVVVPVLPFSLTDRVDVQQDDVEHWTSALLLCYASAFLLACPATGWITDHLSSRRIIFMFGIFLLALSTALFCRGSSIAVFIVARLLQGGSSAIMRIVSLAILSDSVGPVRIGKFMGFCSIGLNSGLFIGPIIGGLMFEKSGFDNVFITTFILLTADLVLCLLVVEQNDAERCTSSQMPAYWIIKYGFHGTPSICPSPYAEIEDIGPLLLSLDNDSDTPAYLDRETAAPKLAQPRKLPPSLLLLRCRRFCLLLWANFAKKIAITAFDAVLPLFTHDTFGWGPLGGGLIFTPLVLPTLLAPLAGALSDIYGARLFIFGGFIIAAPFSALLRFVRDDTITHIVLLCSLLSFQGICAMLITAPVMAEITYLVTAEEQRQPGIFGPKGAYAQAYALYSFTSAAGLLVGPSWGGFMTTATGWSTMTLTLALFSAITAIPMFLWLR